MNDNILEFVKALKEELRHNINLLVTIDKVDKRDEALTLHGKVDALQWALDTLDEIISK